MLKIITKTLLLSAVTLGSTSYFIGSADAEPKFVFRYTPGSVNVASGGNGNGGGTTEPEIPVEPEEPETPRETNLEIGNGNLIHFDANNDGAVNEGDRLTASFPVTNIGDHTAHGLSANNMTFYIESDIYGFHNQFQSDVTCPPTLASKASGNCSASLVITDSMLPANSKKDYDFKVFLDGFKFTNSGVIDGPYGSDSVNLGSVQDVKFGYVQLRNHALDFENDSFFFDFNVEVESANGEEFNNPVMNLTVPALDNITVSLSNCDEYNHSYQVMTCNGRLDLTQTMVDKIYATGNDLFNLSVDVNLVSLDGRPKAKQLITNELISELSLYYRDAGFAEPSSVTIINTGTNITNQEITINGLTITNLSDGYIRDLDVGVYLGNGANVHVKDICPASNNMRPRQVVNCGQIKYTLTTDQQNTLRNLYGNNINSPADNHLYVVEKGQEEYNKITHTMPSYNVITD